MALSLGETQDMKKKNNLKGLFIGLLCILLVGLSFIWFHTSKQNKFRDFHNTQLAVDHIKLWMSEEDVFNLIKDRPQEEMCVYGYEFNFEDRQINLGFRMDDHTLRRITTKNPVDSLYGIQIGMDVATAKELIQSYGFSQDTQKNRYKNDDLFFTIGSKQGQIVDFLIIEIIDNTILNYAQ